MPRLRIPDDKLDVDALDAAEYDDRDFDYDNYDGELPPADTYLNGYVKKMWWTYTSAEDPMLKCLFIADGNTGKNEQYNGLPVWEQLPLTNTAKFKWKPFIDVFELRLLDIKRKTMVSEDDDNIGAPIEKIGNWEPGENALCRILTKRATYKGQPKVEVRRWLAYDEDEDADEEEEDYEEEEEEAAPPPRRSRPAASGRDTQKPRAASGTTASRAATTKRTTSAKKPASRPTRGRRVSAQAGYDEEPPF